MRMCGAGEVTQELPSGTDLSRHTVLAGTVLAGTELAGPGRSAGAPLAGAPLAGAYVRLLDRTGEFSGEVVSSASGQFRFFAAPGTWTIRALHRCGTGERLITAEGPGLFPVDVTVS
jgi:Protein of unknown function (DUF1416)